MLRQLSPTGVIKLTVPEREMEAEGSAKLAEWSAKFEAAPVPGSDVPFTTPETTAEPAAQPAAATN